MPLSRRTSSERLSKLIGAGSKAAGSYVDWTVVSTAGGAPFRSPPLDGPRRRGLREETDE
jgi:hypothetical protein